MVVELGVPGVVGESISLSKRRRLLEVNKGNDAPLGVGIAGTRPFAICRW